MLREESVQRISMWCHWISFTGMWGNWSIHCRLGRILPRSHEKLSDNSKVFSSVCICRNFVDVVHCYVKGRICPEDLNVMPLDIIHRYVRQLENQQPFVVVLQFIINELKWSSLKMIEVGLKFRRNHNLRCKHQIVYIPRRKHLRERWLQWIVEKYISESWGDASGLNCKYFLEMLGYYQSIVPLFLSRFLCVTL